MPKSKTNTLEIDDINAINRYIAAINGQEFNGEAVEILSNERIRVTAVLKSPSTGSEQVDIDASVHMDKTGRQLREIVENSGPEGILIRTNSGNIVCIRQETAKQIGDNRNDVGQVLSNPSSVPPPPVSAVA